MHFFFFKQKTAYEMRISDWSSDVCSSDLSAEIGAQQVKEVGQGVMRTRLAVVMITLSIAWYNRHGPGNGMILFFAVWQITTAIAGHLFVPEIGRASCRERVCQYV